MAKKTRKTKPTLSGAIDHEHYAMLQALGRKMDTRPTLSQLQRLAIDAFLNLDWVKKQLSR